MLGNRQRMTRDGRGRSGVISVADLERAARRRLPRLIFDLVAGGAGDELAVARNRSAFDQLELLPPTFTLDGPPDTSTTILGESVSMPLVLAPAGYQRMLHRDAELATARAARAAGVGLAMSTFASVPWEDVAQAHNGATWFQLYAPSDDGGLERGRRLLTRAEQAGFTTLCVTVDTQVAGLRLRDRRNQLTLPVRVTPSILGQVATRPRWAVDWVAGGVARGTQGFDGDVLPLSEAGRLIVGGNVAITRDRLKILRDVWPGKLVVKGVLDPGDCEDLVSTGVDGIVVSNHGGRQLDSAPATMQMLPSIVAAVDGRAEVYVDGGVRKGEDIVKAVALGARACLVGRPYLYGLAVKGQIGVESVIEMFHRELSTVMTLLGRPTLSALNAGLVRRSRND